MVSSRLRRGVRDIAPVLVLPVALSLWGCGSSTNGSSGGGGGGVCHYVAVGREGVIGCSPDGSSWSTRTSGTDQDLLAVAARGDGVVVAVGNSGTVLRSGDGARSFHAVGSPTTQDLAAVAVDAKGRFVAAGNDDHAYYSDDGGKTWTASQAIDPAGDVLINDLKANGTDRFLASGTVYDTSPGGIGIRNRVYLSNDGGESWSSVYTGDRESIGGSISSGLYGVATDGSQHYVTVGWKSQAFAASGDPPSKWTASTGFRAGLDLSAVVWDAVHQRFIVGGNGGRIYVSSDHGQSFTAACAPFPDGSSIGSILVVGGRFLTIGLGLAILSSDGGDHCTTVPIAVGNQNLLVFAGAYLP